MILWSVFSLSLIHICERMAEQQLEQIEGTVEDIIYENTDNGYMVFEVSGGGVRFV